ncbi:sodium/glutamate symporter [Anaerosphaera multitolerans]|uniref:Sodium/glutamate symporter n=1 Tax=Anaerosphaera multitolerans TaxID=2487351 RepID=A0A437S4Q6_9FIRM|nr:sodium/glutamate symporter [Anaerosphaera multitolerans]RVU53968.1 sodium/glutamate symporter [Anaerosphaera multitolerans]
MELNLNMMQTVALAVCMFYLGRWLKTKITILDKFCIPSPVVGGLIFAIVHLILKSSGIVSFNLDVTLKNPFMMVFFATIGLGASVSLIKKGGVGVLLFTAIAVVLVALQNGVGIALAKAVGADPLIGLLCGSITMTGGHGTAGAWGPTFETDFGLPGASAIGMAAATFGLVMGSLIGGPIGRSLITRKGLKSAGDSDEYDLSDIVGEEQGKITFDKFMLHLSLLIISIGIGAILEYGIKTAIPGLNIPSYVIAMFIAALFRNVGEATGKIHIDKETTDLISDVALNIFLSIALIELRLWELKAVAGPMLVILIAQTVMMGLFAYFITFNVMGRDFDAAVLSAGHCGFGMGATPNGIANMQSVVEGFGPAPRAFFILPIVGAFFIDILNVFVITLFVNFF